MAPETGVPDLLAHFVSNHGFTLDPSGRFVLVANQDTYRSVIFSIDLETGWFVETG
jgi:6-phosphogluconolactonase (cycloisomerase 2 family)